MKDIIIAIINLIRRPMVRLLWPASNYWLATKSLKPLSNKFGYDRGLPIDRYWIESFLETNRNLIHGHCLEVTDDAYTKKYGGDRVTKSDVMDIDSKNKKATIYADIRDIKSVKSNTFDTIILTHVLGIIDDFHAAVSECHRILKSGGVIIATSSCLSPTYDPSQNMWRFTPSGAKYLFTKHFGEGQVEIEQFGNALAGQCFWVGMSQEELTQEQLDYKDPKFPCVVGIIATKK